MSNEPYSQRESDLMMSGLEQRIDHKLDKMIFEIREGFQAIDARFQQVDARFEQVDARFEQVEDRIEQTDRRISDLQAWVIGINAALLVAVLITQLVR